MQNDPENTYGTPPELSCIERRESTRYLARAKATIYRETDVMRKGLPASARDIAVGGLGLLMEDAPPNLDEIVKVRLVNEVQRFDREVRGCVRHVTTTDDGKFVVGIELLNRLTPLEVSLLRLTCTAGLDDDGPGIV